MKIHEEIYIWNIKNGNYRFDLDGFIEALEYGKDVVLESGPVALVTEDSDFDGGIFKIFSVNDRLYRIDGTDDSWSGAVWDGVPYEVEAQPINKVIYVRKK